MDAVKRAPHIPGTELSKTKKLAAERREAIAENAPSKMGRRKGTWCAFEAEEITQFS